jgi:cytochrome c-type biogenesis protein
MDLSALTVFGAGLLTFLTPCVLPVIPLYLATLSGGDIAGLSAARRGVLLLRAVAFSLGFIAVFALLGLGASSLGAVLSTHKALVSAIGALVIAVFALKFLGLVQIPLLDRVAKLDDSRFSGTASMGSALLLGAVFAAGWSPCVGPVLGSVLTFTAARTTSSIEGAAWLGLYGLGFALPLLVLAGFAEAGVKVLRRASPFLPAFERAVGALLVVVAGAMLLDATAAPTASTASMPSVPAAVVLSDQSEKAQKVPRMVELYAPSCPICARMKPTMDKVISACDNQGVEVEAIDVSQPENKTLVTEHRVVGVPTFLFFDEQGQEVARLVGEQSEATLFQALSALRGQECPGLALIDTAQDNTSASGELRFPEQKKEVVTCRSTNMSVNSAPRNSRSFDEHQTPSRFDVQNAQETPESCSRDLL